MRDSEADYLYEVWRRGGNPDAVDIDDIPRDFDWTWEAPCKEHLPRGQHFPHPREGDFEDERPRPGTEPQG